MKKSPLSIAALSIAAALAPAYASEIPNFRVSTAHQTPQVQWVSSKQGTAGLGVQKAHIELAAKSDHHVALLKSQLGFSKAGADTVIRSAMHDTGRGAVIAQYKQQINGIEVFGQKLNLVMNRQGQAIAQSGTLSTNVESIIKEQKRLGKPADAQLFPMAAEQALAAAAKDLGLSQTAFDFYPTQKKAQYQHFSALSGFGSHEIRGDVRSKPVYFDNGNKLIPAWYLEMARAPANSRDERLFGYVISAVDGSLLFRKNLTQFEGFGYRVYADTTGVKLPWDGPQGRKGHPHPTGASDDYFPSFDAPNLVTVLSGPISTNDPWLAPGATETAGNNVDAYADLVAPNGFGAGDLRGAVNGSTPGGDPAFDYLLDTSIGAKANDSQSRAAAVEMFYVINWLHDWFYDSGFNETAGNAQESNYGRGGLEGDRLRGEAQDNSGTNNANMSTPADGSSPRMQMYIYNHPGDAVVNVTGGSNLNAQGAAFGPQDFAALTGELVLYVDGTAPSGDACEDATNGAALSGKIALIDRGTCFFTEKVKRAQAAGAVGVLITNNVADGTLAPMGGSDETVTIPSLGLSKADGDSLKTLLGAGAVNVTLNKAEASRDSSFDALTIAHEWGHYISNRLVGNSAGLDNNQGGSMGEGWGDFHALLMTVEASDTLVANNASWDGLYSMGGYSDQGRLPNDAYYAGIRGVPYTTNMAINPLTFVDIADNPEVHASGTVWASMLWECYASLLKAHPFADAQQRMKDYLVASYIATPDSPTFNEARDAMLTVVKASDTADYQRFIDAFAKRGLGAGAISPDRYSEDHAGVVESFSKGAAATFSNLSLTLTKDVDNDGVLDQGDEADLNFSVTGTGFSNIAALTVDMSNSEVTATSVSIGTLAAGEAKQGKVHFTLGSVGTGQKVDFTVRANASEMEANTPRTRSLSRHVNYNLTKTLTNDNADRGFNADWEVATLSGDAWELVVENISGSNYGYRLPDLGRTADIAFVSPEFMVASDDKFIMSWSQAFSFEIGDNDFYYDGGMLEYQVDGGLWQKVTSGLSPAYTGQMTDWEHNPTMNNQFGYFGVSESYPTLAGAQLNLTGKGLAGKRVKVRFRLGSDPSVSDEGWLIDNISVSGVSNKPFSQMVANTGTTPPPTTPPPSSGGGGGGSFGLGILALLPLFLRRKTK